MPRSLSPPPVPRGKAGHAAPSSLRSVRWGMGFALLSGLALCFVPLFGTLGPEGAIALGVLLPPWAAVIGARAAHHAQKHNAPSSVLLCQAIAHGWLLVAIPVGLLALNALRFKTCEPFAGLWFIALGPLAGVTLASIVGVMIGASTTRARLSTVLALFVPLIAIVKALYDFVATPGIFAFGHFFGYFPGTFYDRHVEVPDAWLMQRGLDVLIGVSLWALVVALRNRGTGTFRMERGEQHPGVLALAIICSVFAMLLEHQALEHGQRTSSRFVTSRLGLAIDSVHCRTVVPRELDIDEAQRLARDCDFRVSQLEARLGVRESERITAFMFRSASEKRDLMGAARVYIAKPWRREVYLQLSDFPHPVIAHELAHVVARHAARGPFGIAGYLGGLIPEPTLVEGLAVALDPTSRDELTPHQWARAAQLANVAPSLETLLGASFFGSNQALAYTLAGSFLGHVLETRGKETVREIYRRGDVVAVLGRPWKALETEWRSALESVPLPAHARSLAEARFERPGVFSQICPHTVERLESELSGALSAGDTARAITKCRAVLEIDPNDTGARATLVASLARAGDAQAAHTELKRLQGPPSAPSPVVSRARTGLADAMFLRGAFKAAEAAYRELLLDPLPEAELRQIEVKLVGLEAGDPTRRWVGELLIGSAGRAVDTRSAMHAIGEIRALRSDGLGIYLAARQLSAAGRHDLAVPLFSKALREGLPTRRLRVEAHRQLGVSAFKARDYGTAQASFAAVAALPDATLAEKIEAQDWTERLAYRATP